jgi:hypothetical protein
VANTISRVEIKRLKKDIYVLEKNVPSNTFSLSLKQYDVPLPPSSFSSADVLIQLFKWLVKPALSLDLCVKIRHYLSMASPSPFLF